MSFNGRDPDRIAKGLESSELQSSGSDLERKYWLALGLFGLLAVLVWFTIGEGSVLVRGKPIEIRLIAVLVIGSFALRTFLARQADRIRHSAGENGNPPPEA